MTGRLRGTVIGCGFFAENHLNGWASIPGVELVAVCDLDPAKAASAAKRFGAGQHYTDAATMLREQKPDFVDIATTVASHRALVELAAAERIPAIVQKPFGPTMADCEAMVAACAAAGVPLMVHENFRFQPPLRALRELTAEGLIGTPHFGRISFRTGHDIYVKQPYLATEERFIISDVGVHVLDIARFYFGEVASIACRTKRVNPNIKGEDTATMLLQHVGGVVSVVDCSYSTPTEPGPVPRDAGRDRRRPRRAAPGAGLSPADQPARRRAGAARARPRRRCPGPSGPGTSCRRACSGSRSTGSTASSVAWSPRPPVRTI